MNLYKVQFQTPLGDRTSHGCREYVVAESESNAIALWNEKTTPKPSKDRRFFSIEVVSEDVIIRAVNETTQPSDHVINALQECVIESERKNREIYSAKSESEKHLEDVK